MNDLIVSLKTENMALARIEAVSDQSVVLKIEATDKWNAEGLVKLAAMLKGVAATLIAGAVLFGFMTVADATVWSPWFNAAEAYYKE